MRFFIFITSISLSLFLTSCKNELVNDSFSKWQIKGGDAGSRQYSSLDQINIQNVNKLSLSWRYSSGDADSTGRSQIQCSPIIIDSILYATTPKLDLIALHAATGAQLWRVKPEGKNRAGLGVNRGVVYWSNGNDKRIFHSYGDRLFAYHAMTGEIIQSFGSEGSIDMHDGLGSRADSLYIMSNTPGVIFKNLIIMGSRVSEGPDAAPGYIRAYDVISGKLVWVFHTIPHPGEPGHETWPPDAWNKVGAANNWSGMTIDHERGWVFIPTGSAAFDFYGGNRKGQNLYANCVLALDALTGKLQWYYQTTHHDILDRDLPSPPVLVQITKDGKKIDALAQATKQGYLFILDRNTGKPIYEVEEKPVPQSDLAGEASWPTQPFPVKPKPYARQKMDTDDINNINPESYAFVKNKLNHIRTGGPYLPPGLKDGLVFPGYDGGAEWGGQAYDPESGLYYINSNEMPWILTMVDLTPDKKLDNANNKARGLYLTHCAVCHGVDMKGDGGKVYPSIDQTQKKYNSVQLRTLIKQGRRVMPAFNYIDSLDLTSIIEYIRHEPISVRKDPAPYNPEIPYSMTGYRRFTDPFGHPAVKPPWGTLNAINLNTGDYAWTIPLGEIDSLTAKGIPITGTENYGGVIITKGGLAFIAATKDERFRAFDKSSGKLLWQYDLPAGGYATPASYQAKGKQFIVIACGGGKMGTKSGDSYLAFALNND